MYICSFGNISQKIISKILPNIIKDKPKISIIKYALIVAVYITLFYKVYYI